MAAAMTESELSGTEAKNFHFPRSIEWGSRAHARMSAAALLNTSRKMKAFRFCS
jgi:hypothetical protein